LRPQRNCGITKAHAIMGPQSVKQRDRIPEAPVEKLLGINEWTANVKWWIRGQTVQDADRAGK